MISTKFLGVVEDNKDPKGEGRVKVRIANVHTTDKLVYPTEELVWIKTRPQAGTSGGKGQSINWLIDQVVELEPTDETQSVWLITGGSNVKLENLGSGNDKLGGNAKDDDKRTSSEAGSPLLSTGIAGDIAKTAMAALNSGLLTAFTGASAGDDSPDIPVGAGVITTEALDWSVVYEKVVTRFGLDLGNIEEGIRLDGRLPPYGTVDVTLIDEVLNDSPGGILGRTDDGYATELRPTYSNKNLKIPTLIRDLQDYTIRYSVVTVTNPGVPVEGTIKIKVVDLPADIPDTRDFITPVPRGAEDNTASIQDITIKEYPNTTIDAQNPMNNVQDNGGVQVENDATKGNIRYAIAHNHSYSADKEQVNGGESNPDHFSRFEMNKEGKMLHKSADDMVIISKKNLNIYVENMVQQKINEKFTMICDLIQFKGDMRIEGDVHITGKVVTDNTITASEEITSGIIGLQSHHHEELNGTDDGLVTTSSKA